MKRFIGLFLACLFLLACGLACEKDQEVLFSEPFPEIPAGYGSLVAVTPIPDYPDWSHLWFQDDEGTIRIMRVQLAMNKTAPGVKTIERSGRAVEQEVMEDEK